MSRSRSKVAEVIADEALQASSREDFAKEVAAFLLSERRTNELDSLIRDIQEAWTARGRVEVIVASAHEINDKLRDQITAKILELYPDAKKIILNEVHDPEIIGGVRLSFANQQLDLSIEAKLNKLKQLTNVGRK